jgi:hypothetical protein
MDDRILASRKQSGQDVNQIQADGDDNNNADEPPDGIVKRKLLGSPQKQAREK